MKESALKSFLEDLFPNNQFDNEIHHILKNGTILCKFVNIIEPNKIATITKKNKAENFENFLSFLTENQVEFDSNIDLFDEQNIQQLTALIEQLALKFKVGKFELFENKEDGEDVQQQQEEQIQQPEIQPLQQEQEKQAEISQELAENQEQQSEIQPQNVENNIDQQAEELRLSGFISEEQQESEIKEQKETLPEPVEESQEKIQLYSAELSEKSDCAKQIPGKSDYKSENLDQFQALSTPATCDNLSITQFLLKSNTQSLKTQGTVPLSELIDLKVDSPRPSFCQSTKSEGPAATVFEKFDRVLYKENLTTSDIQRCVNKTEFNWQDHGEQAFNKWVSSLENRPLKLSYKQIKLTSQPVDTDFLAYEISILVECPLASRYFSEEFVFQFPKLVRHEEFIMALPKLEFENSKQLFEKYSEFKLKCIENCEITDSEVNMREIEHPLKQNVAIMFRERMSQEDLSSINIDTFNPQFTLKKIKIIVNSCIVLNYQLDKSQRSIIFNQTTGELTGTSGQSKIKKFFKTLIKK